MMPARIEPQDGDSALAAHAHRFTLRGDPGSWDFPALCPNCGAAAPHQLVCSKVFRRTHSDSPNSYLVASVAVPFCDGCIARHRAQAQPPTPLRQVLSSFATGDMLGALFPGMAAAFVVWLALKDLFDGRVDRFLVMLAVAGFGAIAWFQRRHVWQETAYLRVPPQSDVTQAFDFSDDIAPAFESPRFVCTVRDARFASAFEALNRPREWVADSAAARADQRQANRKAWIVGAMVGVIALVGIVSDWLE
jgi:hypothetical protein